MSDTSTFTYFETNAVTAAAMRAACDAQREFPFNILGRDVGAVKVKSVEHSGDGFLVTMIGPKAVAEPLQSISNASTLTGGFSIGYTTRETSQG